MGEWEEVPVDVFKSGTFDGLNRLNHPGVLLADEGNSCNKLHRVRHASVSRSCSLLDYRHLRRY